MAAVQVACPECGTATSGKPGADVVCPACMASFQVPEPPRVVRYFDVQLPDGSVREELSRFAVREGIYVGAIPVAAKARRAGGGLDVKWEGVAQYAEFAAVFRLLGVEPPLATGTRRLSGWKGVGRAVAHMPTPAQQARPVQMAEMDKAKFLVRSLPIPMMAAVLIGAFFLLTLALVFGL